MADQAAAVVDLPDEYTEEWGNAFTVRAYKAAVAHASRIALDISDELSRKKNPVHKKLLHDAGIMLDTVQLAARGAFKAIKEEGRSEEQIIAEITRGETGYPPQEVAPPSVVLAEIIAKRDAINRIWDQHDAINGEGGGDDKARERTLYEAGRQATAELQELTLRAIAEGRVPGRAAAEGMLGLRALHIDAIGHVAQEGAEA